MKSPQIQMVDGIAVIREDLVSGGTKARFLHLQFKTADEVCYASSHCGGGQVSLALTAKKLNKLCTIFTAARAVPHNRQIEAAALGARFEWIRPGYQNVITARAREYCKQTGATLAPFGLRVDGYQEIVAEAAISTKCRPDYVWVAAGSGSLAHGLHKAWPHSQFHLVEVGAKLDPVEFGWATVHTYPRKYSWAAPSSVAPFNSDRHYELKCYDLMKQWQPKHKRAMTLFWNTMGSAKV